MREPTLDDLKRDYAKALDTINTMRERLDLMVGYSVAAHNELHTPIGSAIGLSDRAREVWAELESLRHEIKRFVSDLEISLDLETHTGTDPTAWTEGVIAKLKNLTGGQVMWSQPQKQGPKEKIRKAQWTPENTANTQNVVDVLYKVEVAMAETFGQQPFSLNVQAKVRAAMIRFRQLDGGVVLQEPL